MYHTHLIDAPVFNQCSVEHTGVLFVCQVWSQPSQALLGLISFFSESRHVRAEFRPERADFRPKGAWGGQMDGRTGKWMKVPCVLQDLFPFRAAALLPLIPIHLCKTWNPLFGQWLQRRQSPIDHRAIFVCSFVHPLVCVFICLFISPPSQPLWTSQTWNLP